MSTIQINSAVIVLPLVGLIFLLAGLIMRKSPPPKVNYIYGYRTRRSMRDQQSWEEGNRVSAILMIRYGMCMIVFGLVATIVPLTEISSIIAALFIVLVFTFMVFVKTERHLKRKFGK
ncbi:MAG: hypothetical protein DWQ44_00495 [Bacteroidetes bacterium]|nr:MAG: hypothetical protein DWQ33_03870 [Bacteroidota bacterium]REK07576.1 MAG: hypothetical protein DWQ39_01400 [Bacteroidota bacterium]REK36991.1 MAG: hypothetical protein DWQ44_00495 [Bacteroidota bacterium]REK47812.1 MAG: hypothetical protein DWQ48_11555 [Bacteroidota bacterium]